jgi:hypothetical protein
MAHHAFWLCNKKKKREKREPERERERELERATEALYTLYLLLLSIYE